MHRLVRAGIAVVLLVGVLWAGGVAIARPGKSVVVCENTFSHTVRIYGSGCIYGREVKHVWPTGDEVPALCYSPVSRFVKLSPVNGCDAGLKVLKASSGSRALVCADTKSGVLRWPRTGVCWWEHTSIMLRLKSTSSNAALAVAETPATTTTSTTSATSTTAVVVPSVTLSATSIQGNTWPKAVTVTTNVAGTVYFAEGAFVVKTVADITSAPSYRWAQGTVTSANTPTSIAIDVDAVTNGYYRVFVANSQGVLSAPATNIVTISIPRTPTAAEIAAATTIALTCAQGGSCTVGVDTGPGGGIVFYVDMGGFDCPFIGDRCNYLEAARTAGDNPWVEDGQHYWSEDSAREFGTSEGIGAGLTNSQVMICPFDECYEYFVGGAALRARSFDYNARAFGWHLPSRAELQELDFRSNIVGLADDRNYWSSSEDDATQAWMLEDEVAGSGVVRSNSKNLTAYVRPIRAFSATVGPARNWFSTVSISDASIIADGSSTSVITVRLKDGFQNNLTSGGDEITFYTPDLGSIGATTDNGDGTYTAVYTSGISSERVLIWVAPLVNGQDLLFSASVELTARGEPIPVVVAPVVVAPVLVAPVVVAPVVVAPVVVTPAPSMNPTPSAQMLRVGTIFMAPGSYSLNDSTKTSLREMAKNIKNSKKKVIYVTGYPDRRMGENNTLLSQRRAKAVANYLQLFLKGKKIVVSRASTVKLLIPGNPVRDSGTNGGVEIRTK